ncbi:MAG TPA: hypothetical protein PLE45_09795 [Spirochaetota bacterium]|nr:hypothetical protein [Spirochaetota bacterium]HOL57392.1 hypothetical protein [Spirochaetota bacterium]HPP04916.1 hypothetical protein [Spirochaetota bacterium]
MNKILANYKAEHELHFKVNSAMREKLESILRELNLSLSGLIVYILQLYVNRIKKRYCFGNEDENKYERINANSDIHAYISKEDYRLLKKVHADLNFFSMAKLLREIIKIFIEEYEKMGVMGVEKKCSLVTLWLLLKLTKIKRWRKKKELSHFEGNITPFYKAIYNSCYQVIGFETYY